MFKWLIILYISYFHFQFYVSNLLASYMYELGNEEEVKQCRVFYDLFIFVSKRKGEQERETFWFTPWVAAMARGGSVLSQELLPNFPRGWQRPMHLGHILLSHVIAGNCIWSEAVRTWTDGHLGCLCHRRRFNVLCHGTSPRLLFEELWIGMSLRSERNRRKYRGPQKWVLF